MCQGKFLKKDEYEGWEIYEDLAEKTFQCEPTSDKSKNSNPTLSNGSFHSIETSIATEAKFASVMRRLEAKLKS